ncbi:lytic transglycosylase domain-containing protein [Escherichia coli]|uniref:lytic transglycosylase domain-containing protein n=1 Tax=Escherichia coli TaxID=562 RepID=UPI0019AA0E0C|nr:lytic transglycosylase domain-containing protein [Escherichia coli]CAD6037247.1 lytic transglycosylase, catalytic [Escherichia coli]CAD6099370.1 lytic transglycosylase, catalytic [Escherichia coli]CAD6176116.1 lytic transglycosylase, catalytic [Escherichia coli]
MENSLPVLKVDFNEENIKKLEALCEKMQNALRVGPSGQPLPIPPELLKTPSLNGGSGKGAGSGKKGKDDLPETMFDKFVKSLSKDAQSTLKTYKQINRVLDKTTNGLEKLFKRTVKWGVSIAALSGGSAFGYDRMTSHAAAMARDAQGLNMTTGQMQAARNVYGARFSGTENIMYALASAQNNPSDPHYAGLHSLGIDPKDGAAKNLPKFFAGVAKLLKQYKDTGVSYAVLKSYGLEGMVDVDTANQILQNGDRIAGINQNYTNTSRRLDSSLGRGTLGSYQALETTFSNNVDDVGNTFLREVAKLNGPLGQLSDEVTKSVKKFLTGGNFSYLVDKVKTGVETLGNWIGGDNFQADVGTFCTGVGSAAKALGGFVGFAAKHPWLFGAVALVGPEMLNGIASATVAAMLRNPSIAAAVAYGVYAYNDRENIKDAADSSWRLIKENFGKALSAVGIDTDIGRRDTREVRKWPEWANVLHGGKSGEIIRHYQANGMVYGPNIQPDIPGAAQTSKLQDMVNQVNRAALLPENMLSAVAKIESHWNPAAVSKKGAKGLFQFMDQTARQYGLTGNDVFDPRKAAMAAARYFSDNLRKYGGNIAESLAQYNGGNIAVGKGGRLNVTMETINYLLKAFSEIRAMREQNPLLEGKLLAAKRELAATGKDGRVTIQLKINQEAGLNILDSISGQQIPG